MAGQGRGFFFLPEVNDEVLVAFEQGNVHRAYILGALWNGRDDPPRGDGEAVDDSGQVVKRIIRSRVGHTILLDDSDGAEKLVIEDEKNGNTLTLDGSGIKVEGADNVITLDANGAKIEDRNGNVIIMSSTGGTVGNGISLNGTKQVVLRPLIDWLLRHKHIGSTGAPTPLSPDDFVSLQAQSLPRGGLLSDEVLVK
jgi:uncharacterized protein involved in type VI secretion and phage assembly